MLGGVARKVPPDEVVKRTSYWNGICNTSGQRWNTSRKHQLVMTKYRKALATLLGLATGSVSACASAQIELPRTVVAGDRDSAAGASAVADVPISLQANLGARILTVSKGNTKLRTYAVAIGNPKYPTPQGIYGIRKIVWNPSWRPPPGSDWAKGKKP